MNNDNTVEILKCIADASRLAILNILYEGDSYTELIASKLELTPATVCYHLKKMESCGIVKSSRTQFYMIYSLNKEMFNKSMAEILFTGDKTKDREISYREEIINRFIVDGRLISIPSQKKKLEIVISYIAEQFELGKEYTEREVNRMLVDYHDDFCTIRRDLIGFGFMERNQIIYKRIK